MKRMLFLSMLIFFILTILNILGCRQDQKPNILWITCEDISPALGCYGDEYAITPNLDQLAKEGVLYKNAFATAPICAPARSCLITGVYATSLGTQHLRSDVLKPDFIKTIPEYLREQGYYCTNNHKTDYNFNPDGVWDENSREAHWRNRPKNSPFFSIFNYGISHEGHGNKIREKDTQDLEIKHKPEDAALPPYFPDTPEMRRILAHYYDLISVLDDKVGDLLEQLEKDGLKENTIIFFFSDHGFGLPRYKRWLYNTGLHVPLIIHVPEQFQNLTKYQKGEKSNNLISFVDFAPTVLNLIGAAQPEHMQGFPFLGKGTKSPRDVIFGARSRADDLYDVSRAVRDKRYIYIRNYMPHVPYIQDALIFGDQKASFKELKRAKREGQIPEAGERMWQSRPMEELFDLQQDPFELNNLADSRAHQSILEKKRKQLRSWILESRDTGFLHEAEYMLRSKNSTPYEMVNDLQQYNLEVILEAAELTGDQTVPIEDIIKKMNDSDSGVRFWAVIAATARGKEGVKAIPNLINSLSDDSPSVQIAAAEALCHLNRCTEALPVLVHNLKNSKNPTVVLQAATSIRTIGKKAKPILPVVKDVLEENSGEVWGRYKSGLYPMFIGFALEQTLINCAK